MKKGLFVWLLLGFVVLAGACRDDLKDDTSDDVVETEDVAAGEGVEGDAVEGPGYATITFFVDDRATKTFADGQMKWTGTFSWDEETNFIVFSAAWMPTDGPFPPLYDDGPRSEGGHEMEGAEAGDHIFSAEVYFKGEEDEEFQFGVLNELDFWMWEGPNGQFTVKKGSQKIINLEGLILKEFGAIDLKLLVNPSEIHPDFAYILDWQKLNVYVKGTMNMWTPIQILDMGPEINKGDEVADDGVFTFVQGRNLGVHTGLLYEGAHAQFTVMFSKNDETYEEGIEYKLLTEGTIKGPIEGIEAYLDCAGDGSFAPVDIIWEADSEGKTMNSTVVADCGGVKPECMPDDGSCQEGTKCIDGKCKPWCDTDEQCEDGEICTGNQCVAGCGSDEDCDDGEKCIETVCEPWCEADEDCDLGYECMENQCVEKTELSTPKISSVEPTSGPTTGGTLVTVTGTGFLDGAKVVFDDMEGAGLVVMSATEIQCVTPKHNAWKVDVRVINPDGGKDTFIKGFTYLEEALAPTISSVDPWDGPVTGGTEVNIYGTNFQPNPTVLFGATLAAAVLFKDSGHVAATTPSGSLGPVNVSLKNSDGQEAVLETGFIYVPNVVDYVKLLPPLSVTALDGFTPDEVFVEAWEPGVTAGAGAGPGLQVHAGYGPPGVDPANGAQQWVWVDAAYVEDAGNNDVWKALFMSVPEGEYRFTFRVSMDGENWEYADAGGSGDGFQLDEAGQFSVVSAEDGPVLVGVSPSFGTVAGGNLVTLTGAGFEEGLTLKVDGAAVEVNWTSPSEVTFVAPAHAPGAVDIEIKNPGGETTAKGAGFEYVLKFTPSVDGDLEEWGDEFIVAHNMLVSNWDPASNALYTLYAAYDGGNLYLSVEGIVEEANYVLAYVDADYGLASGYGDMSELSDNDGNGDLDDALSNVLSVLDAGFGAEFAFGTQGLNSFMMGTDLGESKFVGWRGLSGPDNLAWLSGTVMSGEGVIEAAFPMATLCPDGVSSAGKEIAVFVRISNAYGGYDGVSNQSLPEYYDVDAPETVGEIAVFKIRL